VAAEYAALVLFAVVSAVGVPGPGDSALIAAALLAAEGHLRLSLVLLLAFLGCLVGRAVGYWVGSAGGRTLLERPGPLQGFRGRTLSKGDRLFRRFSWLAPLLAPAVLSGIYRVAWPVFAVASVVIATWWTLATGLGAYLLGPAAADILSDLGVRGATAVAIIAALALLCRYLIQRRNPPETGSEQRPSSPDASGSPEQRSS
jgi:membrane protein DedA with SNARE-associated domain